MPTSTASMATREMRSQRMPRPPPATARGRERERVRDAGARRGARARRFEDIGWQFAAGARVPATTSRPAAPGPRPEVGAAEDRYRAHPDHQRARRRLWSGHAQVVADEQRE